MDVNGMPVEGFYSTNVPAGLGVAPPLSAALQTPVEAINESVGYDAKSMGTEGVTESEMEQLIMEYKAARSTKRAEAVLNRQVSENDMPKVLDRLDESGEIR
mgnify:CR=1 FL=1